MKNTKDLINIINLAKKGDLPSKKEIYNKFYFLIVNITNKFYSYFQNGDDNYKDLLQEASIAFFKGLDSYNNDLNSNFTTYIYITIKNHLINYLKKIETLKNRINIYELDEKIKYNFTEEDLLFSEELYKKLEKIFLNDFSKLEREIFLYYLNNYSYKEISEILKKGQKSIDNAIYRAKYKIINKLNSNEKNFLLNQKSTIIALKNILIKIKNL